jgi:hypothetical protein
MYKLIFIVMTAVFALAMIAAAQTDQDVVKPQAGITIEPVLCTGVEDRMPIGEATNFPADVEKVYLWTKITGAKDMVIHHVWLHEGREMADVELTIKGSPWRTYSYKTIPPEWAGNWEAKIVGPDGNVLKSISFTVGAKAEEK